MIILYTRDGCSYCEQSKNILINRNLDFKEFKIGENITRDEVIKLFPTAKLLPVIIWNDEYIGGYEELLNKLFELDNIGDGKDANQWR